MKILVIGGSYFYGRVFVMEAVKEHEVTVVNRGTYSMENMGAAQMTGDRHDTCLWENIQKDFDVAVDFCGYEKGDIQTVLDHIGGRIGQYIFISTVDVYERGIKGFKTETTPYLKQELSGEAGAYIAGKIALEKELSDCCSKRNIPYTILRPAVLYGPFNYAPRESVFIQLMVQQRVLPRITDAKGRFQFVYVKDAAGAVLQCMGNEHAYNEAYNLCGDELLDYGSFADALVQAEESADTPADDGTLRELPMTVEQAEQQGLLLPFPVTEAETECYSNEKSKRMLGMKYVSLKEGMLRTYRAFWNVYHS